MVTICKDSDTRARLPLEVAGWLIGESITSKVKKVLSFLNIWDRELGREWER